MILLAHPTGNANVRHAALALSRAALLGEFWTCLNHRPDADWTHLLPPTWRRHLQRRAQPAELQSRLHTMPWREALRLLAPRLGWTRLIRHETGPLSIDAVYRALDRRVSRRLGRDGLTGVYAYEDGAEHCFRAAAQLGRLTCYDLPIGYWRAARAVLGEEAQREPAWAGTLTGNLDSAAKNARKDAELALADVVFVASTHTRRTLELAPAFRGSVVVIPYGAPPVSARPPGPERTAGQPLRVLFVGSLGQRKGLSYLFAACRRLGSAVRLTVIGRRPARTCAALDHELAVVRWIESLPHAGILAEMSAHDVFVLPSLFEGFGLVLPEAMAMGLPIITTPHTAGPDLITEGREGFIVPIRDSLALAARLAQLHADPALCREMGRCARHRAQALRWADYEAKLAACVSQALAPDPSHG
jgi:alpha-maltose-1-phosphate synthase